MPGKNFTKDTEEHRLLKIKAREMGLRFGPRLPMDKVQKLIDDHEKGIPQILPEKAQPQPVPAFAPAPVAASAVVPPTLPMGSPAMAPVPPTYSTGKLFMTPVEHKKKEAGENKKKAGKLVRCRITCMNPHKKNWTGEIVSVGSSHLGTYKKFIPYNSNEPYHIPWIIYQHMKERQCRIGTTQRLPNGQEVNRYKLINEYAIEVLDPLTQDELKDLAQRQAMSSGSAAALN